MKKQYTTPELTAQDIQLGVFGDYGNGDDNGAPSSDIGGRFQVRMD